MRAALLGVIAGILALAGCVGDPQEKACACTQELRKNLCVTVGGDSLLDAVPSQPVFDVFSSADGALAGRVASGGTIWSCTGPAYLTARVSGGRFSADSNVYCYLDYGASLQRMDGTFSLSPGAGANDPNVPMLTLIADQDKLGLSTMLHLTLSSTQWDLTKRIAGGAFIPLLQHFYGSALRTDGTSYPVSMQIGVGFVKVTGPDGVAKVLSDTDIGTVIRPRFGGWQIIPGPDKYRGDWTSASLGNLRDTLSGPSVFIRELPSGRKDTLRPEEGRCFDERIGSQRILRTRQAVRIDSTAWFTVLPVDCCHAKATTVDFTP